MLLGKRSSANTLTLESTSLLLGHHLPMNKGTNMPQSLQMLALLLPKQVSKGTRKQAQIPFTWQEVENTFKIVQETHFRCVPELVWRRAQEKITSAK